MTTFTVSVGLEQTTCKNCGGVFALNSEFVDHARNNKGGYSCPYCRTGWSWTQSESDRLKIQLEQKSKELTSAKCEALRFQNLRDLEADERIKLEKKLSRVKKGVCPCCKRTFQNLASHMATQHGEKSNLAMTKPRD